MSRLYQWMLIIECVISMLCMSMLYTGWSGLQCLTSFLLGMLYTKAIQFYVKYYSYTMSLLYYTRYPVLVKEATDNIYCISFRTQCPFDRYIRRVVKHITCAISMSSRIEEVNNCIHITLICGSFSIVWHIPPML